MKRYTQEQIDRANATDLVPFLQRRGEEFKREGKEYCWKKHDSVYINGNQWFRHSQGKGGRAIDFMVEFYEMTFVEAVNEDNENAVSYLENTRGIARTVIDFFIDQGMIFEEKESHSPVFVGLDENGIPRYAHIRNTREKIRIDASGSDKHYGFSFSGSSDKLFVFEAAIDLLSFLSIYPKKWKKHHYVALGGTSERAMKHYLEKHTEIREVVLCLDDDQAGNEGCNKLLDYISKELTVKRMTPALKDWNEVLMMKRNGNNIKACKNESVLRDKKLDRVPVESMDEVQETNVEWLWYPFVPFGKLTIIQGDPGLGKTWLAMTLAAACTNRQELPNMLPIEPFNVLYQTAEDGYGDTIKPRLKACGADLTRVFHIIEDEKDLTMLDERLEKAIVENNVRMVILDPMQAYIGSDVNMNQANETRTVFKKLNQVAERTGCAIIVIGHLNKNNGSQSTYRGLGSIDIFAAARSVILVGRVKKDGDLRVVLQLKDSLAPAESPVAFTLENGKVTWVGEYDITAEQLMIGNEGKKKETKLDAAMRIMKKLLSERKWMYVSDLNDTLKREQISPRTASDARVKLEKELEYGWDGQKKTIKLIPVISDDNEEK